MDLRNHSYFRVTEVPDTVINKDQVESDIEARCGEIRQELLDRFGNLSPYKDSIYIRRGKGLPGGTPVYAIFIGDVYVLISVKWLRAEFKEAIFQAGSILDRKVQMAVA